MRWKLTIIMFLCWLSAMRQVVVYDYDAAGNRVSRRVAVEQLRSPAPRHQHITEPDPAAGRFLSPDPYVQAPDNTQNLNRYTYSAGLILGSIIINSTFVRGIVTFDENNHANWLYKYLN